MPAAKKCELILHIGGAKCGSSAIQKFLSQNATALQAEGVGVPGKALDFESEVTGEQIWFFENAATHGVHAAALGERMASLFAAAANRGLSRLILSAENVCNHPALATAVAAAVGDRPARLVFYVRRQDDFLISSWQQWHLKLYDTLEVFLDDRVGNVACWMSMIEPWAKAFGDDALSVRPFSRDRLTGGDIVADFCDVVALSPVGLSPLAQVENPSIDEALARLAHRVRDVFDNQHDNRFYEVMIRLLGNAALKTEPGSSLLDLDTRRLILSRYAQENEALKRRFLPELGDEPLFRPPASKEVRVVSDAQKLSDDIAMLTRSIYALAERAERLERGEHSGSGT